VSERDAGRALFWLASYPRSGNTWLQVFIHTLLDVIHGREAGGINALNRVGTWEALVDNFRPVLKVDALTADRKAVSKARPAAQERIAKRAPGGTFVKTHLAALKVDGEFAINWKVTKGAAYIVRNPLDVACSWAPHFGVSLDEAIERLALRDYSPRSETMVHELIGSWSQNVASWTERDLPVKPLVMRYEDMAANPTKTFTAFVNHVAGGATAEQVASAIDLSSFDRLRQQEEDAGFVGRPRISTDRFFRRGTVGGWRTTLSKAQVDRIVAAHETQMRRFGYLDDL
jgi:hypothetical protein